MNHIFCCQFFMLVIVTNFSMHKIVKNFRFTKFYKELSPIKDITLKRARFFYIRKLSFFIKCLQFFELQKICRVSNSYYNSILSWNITSHSNNSIERHRISALLWKFKMRKILLIFTEKRRDEIRECPREVGETEQTRQMWHLMTFRATHRTPRRMGCPQTCRSSWSSRWN